MLVRTRTSTSTNQIVLTSLRHDTRQVRSIVVNAADTTSGSPHDERDRRGSRSPERGDDHRGIVLWAAEPCRTLSIVTGHLLRTALEAVNRGRPFAELPIGVGVVGGGWRPVIHRQVAGMRPLFPFRSALAGPEWRNVLVTVTRRDDVRRGRCHALGASVGVVALNELVSGLEISLHDEPRDIATLIDRLTFTATAVSGADCSCTSHEPLIIADVCQRAIVGIADDWL